MVVLTHFKGHSMSGYGGSLKNIAIGCADAKVGKAMQHNADFSIRGAPLWSTWQMQAKQ